MEPDAEVAGGGFWSHPESELNATAPWWPLPGIAGVSPQSRDSRSEAPTLPTHPPASEGRKSSRPQGVRGLGEPQGESRGEPPEDSQDKGSSVTESGRGEAGPPGRMPASRDYKKTGLKRLSLHNLCSASARESSAPSDKLSRRGRRGSEKRAGKKPEEGDSRHNSPAVERTRVRGWARTPEALGGCSADAGGVRAWAPALGETEPGAPRLSMALLPPRTPPGASLFGGARSSGKRRDHRAGGTGPGIEIPEEPVSPRLESRHERP